MTEKQVVVRYDDGSGTPAEVWGLMVDSGPHVVILQQPCGRNGSALDVPMPMEKLEIPRHRIYHIAHNPREASKSS